MGTGVLGDNVKTNLDAYTATLTGAQKAAFTDAMRKSMLETMFNAVEDWVGQRAVFSNRQAWNVAGGSATGGVLGIYPLNTTELNNISGCSRSTTDITLPAGTYVPSAWATFFKVNRARLLLYTTGGSLLCEGGEGYFDSTTNSIGHVHLLGKPFVLASTTVIELKYEVQSTENTDGLGLAWSGVQTENTIFGELDLLKIG